VLPQHASVAGLPAAAPWERRAFRCVRGGRVRQDQSEQPQMI